MKAWLTGCLAAALLFGGASLGRSEDGKDKNKDKEKDKAAADLEAQFKKLDTGGNGTLYLAEYVGNKQGEEKTKAEKLFRRKDKDKDLQLTLAEFKREVQLPDNKKKKDAKKAKPKAKKDK